MFAPWTAKCIFINNNNNNNNNNCGRVNTKGKRYVRNVDELSVRRVQSALVRYRDESLQKLLFNAADYLADDLIKVREDTEWERCSHRPATANAVKMKNRGERQRLGVYQLYLERQLARELRRIDLERSELADWWQHRVTPMSTPANVQSQGPQHKASRVLY